MSIPPLPPIAPYKGTSPLAQRANKILRTAGRSKGYAPVTSQTWTITPGTAGAASTITNAGNSGAVSSAGCTDTPLSTRLRVISGTCNYRQTAHTDFTFNHVTAGTILAPAWSTAVRPYCLGNRGNGFEFFFNGQFFDFGANGSGMLLHLIVTDLATGLRQRYSASDVALTSGASFCRIDFGSRGNRIVELYIGANTAIVYGFCFDKRDQVRAVQNSDEATMALLQDSYGAGANFDNIRSIAAYVAGEQLGIRDVLINGLGGTGYLNDNGASGGQTFQQRLSGGDFAVSLIGDRDLIWMIGSVNDALVNNAAYTDAAYQAAVQLAVTTMMAAQPNAIILVAGPQYAKNFQTGATRYAACAAGVAAAANGDPRVVYIDVSQAGGTPWQTGTGTTAAVAGDGSNDYLGASDGVHFNNLGNYVFGDMIFFDTIKAVRAIAASA